MEGDTMCLCAWCEREFEDDVICFGTQRLTTQTAEAKLKKHIRSKGKRGHGNIICSHCKQPLSKCKDIDGVGGSHTCKRKE